MITGLLASAGISIFNKLVNNHGEELFEKGFEKITGIELKGKEKFTEEEIEIIRINKQKLLEFEYKTLLEKNRHEEAKEANSTEKWKSDNEVGGINAKIRPYTLIYLMVVITVFALTDGNLGEFTIQPEWKTLFTSLAVTAFGGYFVLRTYEKSKGKDK